VSLHEPTPDAIELERGGASGGGRVVGHPGREGGSVAPLVVADDPHLAPEVEGSHAVVSAGCGHAVGHRLPGAPKGDVPEPGGQLDQVLAGGLVPGRMQRPVVVAAPATTLVVRMAMVRMAVAGSRPGGAGGQ